MPSFVTFDEFLKCCVGFRLCMAGRISQVQRAEAGSVMDTGAHMRPPHGIDKKGLVVTMTTAKRMQIERIMS